MTNELWEEADTTPNEEVPVINGVPWETNENTEENEVTVIQGTPWETSGTSSIGEVIDSVVEANPEVVEQIVSDIPNYTTAYDLSYNPMDEYMVEAEPEERDPSFMENVREGLIAPLGGVGSTIVNSIDTLDWAVGWTDKASALQNITGDFLTYNPEDLDPDVRVAYENADGFHIYDGTGTKVKYITGAGLEKLKEANIVRLAGLAEQVDKAIVTNEDLQAWGYQDSLTGKISGTMSQFLALFLPSSYVTAPLKFGKYTDDVVKGTITGFTAFPSDQERASAMLKEMGLENDFINWLADNEDDSMFEGKFKNAVEEATFGAATGEVIRLTGTLWRGLKVVKAKQDAKSAKESVEKVNEALKKVEEEAGKVIENPADPSTIRLIDPETGEVIKMADEADSSIAKQLDESEIPIERVIGDGRGQFGSTTWAELNAQGAKLIHDFITNAEDPMTLAKFMDEFFDLSTKSIDDTKAYTASVLQMEKYLQEQTLRYIKSPAYQQGDPTAIAKAKVLAVSTAQAKRTRQRLGNIEGTSLNLHGMANDLIPNIDDITLSEDQLLKVIQDASDQGLISRAAAQPRNVVQALNEIFINNILSGPVTHKINITANAFIAHLDLLEEFGGALWSIPKAGVDSKEHFTLAKRKAYGTYKYAWISLKMAGATLNKGRNILDEEGMITEAVDDVVGKVAIGKGNISFTEAMARVRGGELTVTKDGLVDAAGNVIRLPSRALQAEDEFFKQLNFRRSAYAHAAEEIDKLFKHNKDLDPKDFDSMVEDRITKAYRNQVDTPRGEALTDPIAQKAQDDARYNTFTNELGETGKKIQKFTSDLPALRQIAPFIRTPINIVKYPFHRSPLAVFSDQMQKKLKSPDPKVRAKAEFQVAYGSVVWGVVGAGVWYSMEELPYTDKYGDPQTVLVHKYQGSWQGYSPQQRNALKAAGAQPNSMLVKHDDGSITFERYNRLDPIAMIAGMAADMRDVETAGLDIGEASAAMVIAFSNQLKDRTYTKGLANALNAADDPNRFLERWIQGQVAANVVPAFVSWSNDDMVVRETSSVIDTLKSRIGGLSDTLPPVYNIFGEVMMRAEGSIMKTTSWRDDTVGAEFLRLAPRISALPEVKNGLDLLDPAYQTVDKDTGRTVSAHERWNQLIQKSKLLKKLEDRISKGSYQKKIGREARLRNVGTVANENEEDIQAIFQDVRNKAFKKLLDEIPELKQAAKQLKRTIRDIEKGRIEEEPTNPISDFLYDVFN